MVRLIGVVGEEEAKPGRSCTARRQVPLTLEPGLTMVGYVGYGNFLAKGVSNNVVGKKLEDQILFFLF